MRQRCQRKKQASPKPLPAPPKSCEKYKKVSPVVDTGPNVRKRQAALELVRQLYHVRPDEVFGRVRAATLVTLMVEVARLQRQQAAAPPPPPPPPPPPAHREKRADLQSLVEGAGELSLSAGDASAAAPSVDERPYLLLDVRDGEQFEREHIVSARHYPAARLARTINYETAEMWRYRRAADALVVVYDEDEVAAQRCATTLAQRGYDNVFILSGGLQVARRKFPRGLLTSEPREQLAPADIEALSAALDQFHSTADESPRGAASSRPSRSVCSSALRSPRPRAAGSTAAPRWRL